MSSPFLIKNALWFKFYHKSAHFSISHTDAHDQLDDTSIHDKPYFHQITSVFKPFSQHGAIHRGAFRLERMVIGVFGAKKIATTVGVPQSTTKW